jgi:VWFA-related protein
MKQFLSLIVAANILCTGQSIALLQQTEGSALKFSVQSQLVEVYLTVTKGKSLVPNLKAPDFMLAEDGMPIAVDRLDSQDVPLQIVLLVDVSESVRPALKTIQDAAIAFVGSLNPPDRVTLILFNFEIHTFHQTTDDRKGIIREIRAARAQGMTKLYDSMLMGMKYLEGRTGRKAIVCFTDGQDTSGTSSGTAIMSAAENFGYPIYMIGTGAGLELASLQILLRGFAEINGGRAFFIQSIAKLRAAFSEVAAELRSAYVLHYYTQVPPDGRWHSLSIRTLDPACTARGRKGFNARSEGNEKPEVRGQKPASPPAEPD